MDITSYRIRLVGAPPGLVMHSTAGMNDLDPRVRELRALVKSTTAAKRTGAQVDRIAYLETAMSIYWAGGRPHLPAANVRTALEKAARTLRDGPRVRRGLLVTGVKFASSVFDDRTPEEEIIEAVQFVAPVRVGQSTVLRTRALFPDWRARVEVEGLDEMVDRDVLQRWADIAGRLIGLGDWRPDCSGVHGRFTAEVEKIEKVEKVRG